MPTYITEGPWNTRSQIHIPRWCIVWNLPPNIWAIRYKYFIVLVIQILRFQHQHTSSYTVFFSAPKQHTPRTPCINIFWEQFYVLTFKVGNFEFMQVCTNVSPFLYYDFDTSSFLICWLHSSHHKKVKTKQLKYIFAFQIF